MKQAGLLGSAVVLLVSSLSTQPLLSQGSSGNRGNRPLIVDDDLRCSGAEFSTIQSAIDAAQPGDTVRVCQGDYVEQVQMRKPLRLIARPSNKATVHGSIVATGVEGAPAEFVTEINGFVVDVQGIRSGITIEFFPEARVLGNAVFNSTRAGIEIFEADDGLVRRNTVHDNLQDGIRLIEAFDYEVRQNVSRDNGRDGILVNEGVGNLVRQNTSRDNLMNGINVCVDTADNRVERNVSTGNALAGLSVCDFASGTVLTNNRSFDNGIDALDESTGDGTAGTDSFWRNNFCNSSSPTGLCRPSPSSQPTGSGAAP